MAQNDPIRAVRTVANWMTRTIEDGTPDINHVRTWSEALTTAMNQFEGVEAPYRIETLGHDRLSAEAADRLTYRCGELIQALAMAAVAGVPKEGHPHIDRGASELIDAIQMLSIGIRRPNPTLTPNTQGN